jgi:EGF-like domain.
MCEININECDPSPCQNTATCIDGLNNFTCVCASGFEGNILFLMLSGLYFCVDYWKESVVHALEVGLQTLHIAKNVVKGNRFLL